MQSVSRYSIMKVKAESILTKLSGSLHYHSIEHTWQVLYAAEQLQRSIDLSETEAELLRVAVLFHDTGYAEQYKENEPIGAAFAKNAMKNHYSESDIAIVNNLILATQMPQAPNNLLEQIICDSDLASLGSDTYNNTSDALVKELNLYGESITDTEWLQTQIQFLTSHSYFTPNAHSLWGKQKERNLKALHERYQEK